MSATNVSSNFHKSVQKSVESVTILDPPSGAASVTDLESKAATVTENEILQRSQTTDFPDGGLRAWLVVMGASFGSFTTFGFLNAWGVFQAYYTETILSNTSPSTIAWIGSVQYCLIFLPGPICGRLFDVGYFRRTIFCASCCLVAATFLVAQCKEYWQFLLCQGFAVGLAAGMIFGPMLSVIGHWFQKKRGMALGFLALGSSVSGTIFPIAARRLISAVGFQWTMRILGFIQLAALIVTNLTVERRLPPKEASGPFISLKAFRFLPYATYCAATFVAFLGLYTVLTFIDISAVAAGISNDFSFYLVSIANASSGFGRIGGGILADRFGPLNVMIPSTFVAAVLTYAWPFAASKGAFVVIAILYGIASGVYVSLLPAPVMAMGQMHDVGLRIGMSTTIFALGILGGPPIAGAINQATGGFKDAGYYAGSICVFAAVLLILTRQLGLKKLRGRY